MSSTLKKCRLNLRRTAYNSTVTRRPVEAVHTELGFMYVAGAGTGMPSIGDHCRPTGEDAPVYRVVGVTDEVALLRVTDDAGRRASTGDLRHVPADRLDDEFEAAVDPDAGFHPVAGVRNALSGLFWQFRRLL
jgi:hypothetical protein